MKLIPAIWLCFSIIFGCLGWYHYKQSKTVLSTFQWERKEYGFGSHASDDTFEIGYNLKRFFAQWNKYIDQYNQATSDINIAAAIGYVTSSVIALLSAFIPGPYNLIDTMKYFFKKKTQGAVA
ncbi:MAG: hypothetical protein JW932_15515 [Deltaproteobacteria bacterium]|nr:hypothetical protein [Deltaproteobacteria bacterium]